MAAAGIPHCEVDVSHNLLKIEKTRRMILMAVDMMNHASTVNFDSDENIQLKIGIHNGMAIAGIIGNLYKLFYILCSF